MQQRAHPPIAIVGSGIIGLVLAHGLVARSIPVTVYEQADTIRENGAGIGFTRVAIQCLELVSSVAFKAFKSVAAGSGESETDEQWLQWLDGFYGEDEELLMRLRVGSGGFDGCHRQQFLLALLNSLPSGTVLFNKRIESVVECHDAAEVRLGFADGTYGKAGAVVAADGIKSSVRRMLFGESNPASFPQYTHKVAYRTLVAMDVAEKALGSYKAHNQHMHIGPNRHLIHYPIAKHTLLNVTVFDSDPEPWQHEKLVAPASRGRVINAFAGWNKSVRALLDTLPETTTAWGIFDMAEYPLPTYAKGSICLIGDAAHASSPHHGAGAGIGVEDVLCLVTALETATEFRQSVVDSTNKNRRYNAAFEVYSETRKERSQWLVQSSREVCEIYQTPCERSQRDISRCLDEVTRRSHKIWLFDYETMLRDTESGVTKKLLAAATAGVELPPRAVLSKPADVVNVTTADGETV